ncbi:MAG: RNA polymerase sigma factor, partial [Adhaeribacter sp.]
MNIFSYSALADHDLFDLVKSEDEAAFKEIYERYFDVLYIHAYKRLQDKEEAQDVIQEVFTVLWD